MLVKLLGGIDVLAGSLLVLSILTEIPFYLLLFFGIALLIKSFALGFLKEIGSWIDFLTGVVLILAIPIQVPLFIKIIFGILIAQKGVSSFL